MLNATERADARTMTLAREHSIRIASGPDLSAVAQSPANATELFISADGADVRSGRSGEFNLMKWRPSCRP